MRRGHLSLRKFARIFPIVVAVAFSLATGPFVASAVDPGQEYFSCVDKQGTLAGPISTTPIQCTGNRTAVHWNATGPVGAPGAPGADGSPGEKGDKGDTGAAGAPGPALASLDDLDGLSCTSTTGPGTTDVTVNEQNEVRIRCVPDAGGGGSDPDPDLCPETLPSYPNAVVDCDSTTGGLTMACDTDWADANDSLDDGCETNLLTSPEHCGAPSLGIPADGEGHAAYACLLGQPVITGCESGWGDADGNVWNGCEINVLTDRAHCGSIGNAVLPDGTNNANYACVGGQVVITTCLSGWANVDGQASNGCETNVLTDPVNCGAVGIPIPPDGTNHANYACAGGRAVIASCAPGWADVDGQVGNGCESDLLTDPANCGAVGNAVPPDGAYHASYTCTNGQIVITSCQSGWIDADRVVTNGCEAAVVGKQLRPDGILG